MTSRYRNAAFRWLALPALCLFAATAAAAKQPDNTSFQPRVDQTAEAWLQTALDRLRPQRPGVADLYVLGFAGDAGEEVFRNEVRYLEMLAVQRLDAAGHTISLVNHPDGTAPAATLANLRRSLAFIGKAMDPREDLLLLFVSTHGSEEHELYVLTAQGREDAITPEQLRSALDDAGIQYRVVVISACYSGGFVPALREPGTLLITAARHDRPSFGCGNTDSATYFGQAWLVEAMNRTIDFAEAFRIARKTITAREKSEHELPSLPQISIGADIAPRLRAWRAGFVPGPPVPYPYAEDGGDTMPDDFHPGTNIH